MRKFLLLLVLISVASQAQILNDYKYAVVPEKFSFFKEANKYNLNLLSKMFLQKYGFETYYDNEKDAPIDFFQNNCNKIQLDLIEDSNMFSTKIKVVLKDCKGNIIAESEEGLSRDKEFMASFNEALRDAFEKFPQVKNHKYNEAVEQQNKQKVVDEKPIQRSENTSNFQGQLFAQPTANGFQLINTEPKVIMKLLKTSIKDFYIGTKENLHGVFISKNNEWFFEYYQNDKLVSEKVEVKF